MDFSKLTSNELDEFLIYHQQKLPLNLTEKIKLAKQLFNQLKENPQAKFTNSVIDLYLATNFLQSGSQIPQLYSTSSIRNLTSNQKETFGKVFNLDPNDSSFIDRLLRILRILGALESPEIKLPPIESLTLRTPLWNWKVELNSPPIPIKYPVNLKYPNDLITQERSWIRQQSQIKEDLTRFDLVQFRRLYDLYNLHFFNNWLPKNIKLEINSRLTRTGGKCGPCTEKGCECRYKLQLSGSVFQRLNLGPGQQTQSGGVFCYSRLECVQLVLEHEMIHLAIRIQYPNKRYYDKQIYSSHGFLFKDLVRAYFDQTRTTHSIGQIVLTEEEGAQVQKDQIKLGDIISFVQDGEIQKSILIQKGPVYAIVDIIIGSLEGSRKVRYEFLHELLEDDEDQEILTEASDRIKRKYQYYLNLKANDSVQVLFHGQPQRGRVIEIKRRAQKLVVRLGQGEEYIFRYNLLFLPEDQKNIKEVEFIPQIKQNKISINDKVKFGQNKGIVVKINPKNIVVYSLDHGLYNVRRPSLVLVLPTDPDNQKLTQLQEEINRKRIEYRRLDIGDQVRFSLLPYQIGQTPVVETGIVSDIKPRSESLIVQTRPKIKSIYLYQLV